MLTLADGRSVGSNGDVWPTCVLKTDVNVDARRGAQYRHDDVIR